ncbi:hypothetical protein [Streptomyces roseus]|uniref:Uncharacterized protein n=1 Tax=Streptomyces roseus TaxID=66430 RepID=A0A0J6XP77_9ACTN|nr:hypothetical protein [Streptomyces roseus]KMO96057.1 hypothetical protein ACS04_20455 [Streptomyces roseus]
MTPHRFPADLLALQKTREETCAQLAHTPAGAGTAALRRALVLLDLRLATHPYWASPAQWRTGAAELRRTARTQDERLARTRP